MANSPDAILPTFFVLQHFAFEHFDETASAQCAFCQRLLEEKSDELL
ncbi:hypothetical protein [uncultured Rhodoblastus sp.]|nr:hypothetical protein [uncultured Rhodoblastus sp.]